MELASVGRATVYEATSQDVPLYPIPPIITEDIADFLASGLVVRLVAARRGGRGTPECSSLTNLTFFLCTVQILRHSN